MPASPQRQAADRFDILGGAALVLGLVTMLLALNRMRELSAVWFALLSALAFAAFIVRESRAARPIIAVDILKQPGFAVLNLVSVLVNLAAFSVWLLVPYFLARLPAYSLTASGAILATAAAGAALAAPIGGRLAGQHISARRLAVAGAAANGVGLLLLGAWTEQTPTLLRIAGLVVQGVGLGLFQLGYSDIVTAALPLRDRGVAGSLVLLTRTFGTVTSASVIFLVFEILNVKYGFLEGFRKTFQFAAMLAFAGAACSAFSARKSGHSRIS
jgi:MFS family permease